MISEKSNTESLQWHEAIPERSILANEVHVWRVFNEKISSQIKNLEEILSDDELERAGKFYFEMDRKRFIMVRAILRIILSNYVREKPQHLHFKYSAFGKPMLATNPGSDNICFNLSHSNGIALYAVTLNRHAGIDVEHIRHNIDIEQIAKRFFSSAENSLLNNIHEKDRLAMFFKFWTRKEAIVKATGKGVSFPMEQVDVSSINDDFLSTVKLTDENKEGLCFSVQDLFPEKGYAAAIAIAGNDCKIICRHYSP
jgi:4'-phosphopantetheinyl transferase